LNNNRNNFLKLSKIADIGFASLQITINRSEAVSFLYPHIISSVTFITSPPKIEPILTLVLQPFEPSVWVCFISALMIILCNVLLLSHYYIELKKIQIKLTVISISLNQQISRRIPSIISLRIMLCFWLLSCLVLTSSYSGCLHSLMAFPSKMKTIDTITDLAIAQTNGEIQVTVIKSSSYLQSLKVWKLFKIR
jgi:hypothetical protein